MKKIWFLTVLVMLTALALTGCGPQKVTLDMELSEYAFTPNTFVVPAGAEVTLNISNNGTLLHEAVVMLMDKQVSVPFSEDDEPNIYWEEEVEKGENVTVTFTAPSEPGEYQLVCGIPAHIEQGMVGTFIVK